MQYQVQVSMYSQLSSGVPAHLSRIEKSNLNQIKPYNAIWLPWRLSWSVHIGVVLLWRYLDLSLLLSPSHRCACDSSMFLLWNLWQELKWSEGQIQPSCFYKCGYSWDNSLIPCTPWPISWATWISSTTGEEDFHNNSFVLHLSNELQKSNYLDW